MKISPQFILLFVLKLASQVLAAPPMPSSVVESGAGVQHLWNLALRGHFMNTVSNEHHALEPEWQDFLRNNGEDIVKGYYK